jgi:transposase InsO family protein
MAYRLLRREGWSVNHKRVQRLWREEGLQRPTPRKRKRARLADGSVRRHRAELRWSGFSGQVPSLTSEAGYRP